MGISRQQALDCFRSDDLIGIGMEADALRRRLHPEGVVTYRCVHSIDLAPASGGEPWTSIDPCTSATLRLDASGLGQSSSPDLLQSLSPTCRTLRDRFASAWIEVGLDQFSAGNLSLGEAIAGWRDSGANSIFLDIRQIAGDYSRACDALLNAHLAAHALGMLTTIAIPFGGGESHAERLDFLDAVHQLQHQTGGFTSVVPVGLDAPGGRELDGVTAVERLKMLAIARMYLDNIDHVQSAQVGSGLKVLQSGLRFGADDTEIRLSHPGATEQDLRRVIRDAGFKPVERDGAYSTMFLN